MTDKKDGGPAFPCLNDKYDGYGDGSGHYRLDQICPGMSLRDYFAAKVMQALIPLPAYSDAHVVEFSYEMADAMLKARES